LGVAVKRNPLVLSAEHVSPNIVCRAAPRYSRPETAFTAGRLAVASQSSGKSLEHE